ncbi:hypothetical protein BOX15_Mlig014965g3, partial [Macrostomum lignano]
QRRGRGPRAGRRGGRGKGSLAWHVRQPLEDDAEGVEEWTEAEIEADPAKQLITAAENGRLDEVTRLVPLPDPPTAEPPSPLLAAADSDGYRALHRAAYNGHVGICRHLLMCGADVSAGSGQGWTALHSAAFWNQTAVVALLLRAGADPNAATESGQTPLHLCLGENRDPATAQLLLLHPRLDPSAVNSSGETALTVAKRCTPYAHLLAFLEPETRRLN